MAALKYILTGFVGVLIGGFIRFWNSYSDQKGKNLATHEDLQKVIEQVTATTEATKAIEARIDDQVWNKQRQWEIKRDALFEGCRAMAEFNAALVRLQVVWAFQPDEKDKETAERLMLDHRNKSATALNDASNSFERAQLLISIVSGPEVQWALGNMGKILKNLAADVVNNRKADYEKLAPLIKTAEKVAIEAMRRELEIATNAAPLAPAVH